MGRSPKAFMERRLKACTRNRLTSASGKLITQKTRFRDVRRTSRRWPLRTGLPDPDVRFCENTITLILCIQSSVTSLQPSHETRFRP